MHHYLCGNRPVIPSTAHYSYLGYCKQTGEERKLCTRVHNHPRQHQQHQEQRRHCCIGIVRGVKVRRTLTPEPWKSSVKSPSFCEVSKVEAKIASCDHDLKILRQPVAQYLLTHDDDEQQQPIGIGTLALCVDVLHTSLHGLGDDKLPSGSEGRSLRLGTSVLLSLQLGTNVLLTKLVITWGGVADRPFPTIVPNY